MAGLVRSAVRAGLCWLSALLLCTQPVAARAQEPPALAWDERGRAVLTVAGEPGAIIIPGDQLGSAFGPGRQPFPDVQLRIGISDEDRLAALVPPLQAAWTGLSGANLELVALTPEQLAAAALGDAETPLDGVIAPAWLLGDFVRSGQLLGLEPLLASEEYPYWTPDWWPRAAQGLAYWNGELRAVPLSSSPLLLFWRDDILGDPVWQERYREETGEALPYPPQTWPQVLAVARYFNGRNWDEGDLDPDYGLVMPLGEVALAAFGYAAVAGPQMLAPSHCAEQFWFDPDTLSPNLNHEAQVRALELFQQLYQQGPAQQLSFDQSASQTLFLRGKAVFSLAPAELAAVAQDETRSLVKGTLGVSALPGSRTLHDLCSGASTDLNSVNVLANAFGSAQLGLVFRASEHPEAVYAFYALLASKPVRRWRLLESSLATAPSLAPDLPGSDGLLSERDYLEAGWHEADLARYLRALEDEHLRGLSQPYLRLSGAERYLAALAAALREALLERLSPQEALDLSAQEWQRITTELGPRQQREQFEEGPGAP